MSPNSLFYYYFRLLGIRCWLVVDDDDDITKTLRSLLQMSLSLSMSETIRLLGTIVADVIIMVTIDLRGN